MRPHPCLKHCACTGSTWRDDSTVRVAVFSDVHANLPALQAFVALTRTSVDSYVCLGDVVGYGPWNDECLELVHSLPNIVLLEGNHERMFLNPELVNEELPLVQAFFRCSVASFARRDLIEALPLTHALGWLTCAHSIGDRRVYRDSTVEVCRSFIIGHTHHPFVLTRNENVIINCGSIGQNRRRADVLNYVICDTESRVFSLFNAPFPVGDFLRELRARKYPESCVRYYLGKLTPHHA